MTSRSQAPPGNALPGRLRLPPDSKSLPTPARQSLASSAFPGGAWERECCNCRVTIRWSDLCAFPIVAKFESGDRASVSEPFSLEVCHEQSCHFWAVERRASRPHFSGRLPTERSREREPAATRRRRLRGRGALLPRKPDRLPVERQRAGR